MIYLDERKVRIEKENKRANTPIQYSKPMKELVDEHTHIKVLLKNVPKICEILSRPDGFDGKLVLECVEFIKNYADKFHHSKEEDILFKYIEENSEVVKSMIEDHKIARWFVKSIISGVEKTKVEAVIENLTSYGELLTQHIKKEDEILYPFIDRSISEAQINELSERFDQVNQAMDSNFNYRWFAFLDKIEKLT